MGHGVEERLVWDLWGNNSTKIQDEKLIAEEMLYNSSRILQHIEIGVRKLYREYNIPYGDLKSE